MNKSYQNYQIHEFLCPFAPPSCTRAAGVSFFITGFIFILIATLHRQQIRKIYGMPHGSCGTCTEDLCTWFWCSCCATMQEARGRFVADFIFLRFPMGKSARNIQRWDICKGRCVFSWGGTNMRQIAGSNGDRIHRSSQQTMAAEHGGILDAICLANIALQWKAGKDCLLLTSTLTLAEKSCDGQRPNCP